MRRYWALMNAALIGNPHMYSQSCGQVFNHAEPPSQQVRSGEHGLAPVQHNPGDGEMQFVHQTGLQVLAGRAQAGADLDVPCRRSQRSACSSRPGVPSAVFASAEGALCLRKAFVISSTWPITSAIEGLRLHANHRGVHRLRPDVLGTRQFADRGAALAIQVYRHRDLRKREPRDAGFGA